MNPMLLSFSLHRGIMLCNAVLFHQGAWIIAENVVIDPGASYTIMHPKLIQFLGISVDTSQRIKTTSVSGSVEYPKIQLDQIGVENVSVRNVETLVGSVPKELEIQGIIGYTFLKHFDYCVCYQRQEIVLTPI